MQRYGDSDAWDYFHVSLGRYVSAAGHAEWAMFVLLRELQRHIGIPISANPPAWSGLVKAICELPSNPLTERVAEVMRGAERRGRLRNNFIHASWFQASESHFVSRRLYDRKGKDPETRIMSREVLDNDVERMEAFADALEELAGEATGLASRYRSDCR